MRRREFIALLGGAAVATSPFAARAQQKKLPTVGYLGASTPGAAQGHWFASFVQRLRELGWVEGRTVAIEARWAQNRPERYAEIAAEFVRLKVDVIVTLGITIPAVKKVTSVIPVVFVVDGDPVGNGLVDSLARPGGNVTGLSSQVVELAGKRLEFMREILPGLRRVAIVGNGGDPQVARQFIEVQHAARKLGLDVVDTLDIRKAEDLVPAFGALKGEPQALYIGGDPLFSAMRLRIHTLTLGARLPTIYVQRDYPEAGGLVSYGAHMPDLNRRAGDYVDKILRGAKPADLPVEQPTKFELVINLTTAKALGLKIPEAFLLRADEVIE